MVKFRFDWLLLAGGWTRDVTVTAENGVIIAIDSGAGDATATPIRGYGLPGLTSLHSHGFQRGMAGLAETRSQGDESFWTWREVMYRFLDKLTPEDVATITAQAYLEMLESGFTSVAEFHYLHHDPEGQAYADLAEMAGAIAQAATLTGIGLTLLPTLYRFGNFGAAAAGPGQHRFLNTPDRFARLVEASGQKLAGLEDARLGVALHSLRAVEPDDVARAARLLPAAPIHIHAAEQEKEVADCLAWSGRRPVQWLLDQAALDERWCVIHATHLDDAEVTRLAASGAVAGLCPVTEANLGDGIFPAVAYRGKGGRFGVGTDSNVMISASGELVMLEYGQRLRDRQRVRMAAPGQSAGLALLGAALAGGAQASGRQTGALKVGCRADWIVLDEEATTLATGDMTSLVDRAIFAMPAFPVRSVWISGRPCIVDGHHPNAQAIRSAFRHTMRRLAEQI